MTTKLNQVDRSVKKRETGEANNEERERESLKEMEWKFCIYFFVRTLVNFEFVFWVFAKETYLLFVGTFPIF